MNLYPEIPSPCFVLEMAKLKKNLEIIEKVQREADVKVILALKGFAMYRVFHIIKEYLPGTTASSLNEARLGYEAFGEEVHAYSPAYRLDEFNEILSYCNHITFNSLNQWNYFKPVIEKSNKKVSCGLRINPEYSEVEADIYNPCVPGSRLGMRASQIGNSLPEGIEGLHFHTLCENGYDVLDRTLQVVEEKFGHLLPQLKWINLGGGHLMTHKDYDLQALINRLKTFKEKYNIDIVLEPGGAVAWQTGFLKTTVLDHFESGGTEALVIDASVSAHMPDCIEMPYKPFIRYARDAQPGDKPYRIGGMTCLAGDYVGDYTFDEPLKTGDNLIFEDMIHYTMVKTTFFNGVSHPDIGILHENGKFELVKRFGYESFKEKLS